MAEQVVDLKLQKAPVKLIRNEPGDPSIDYDVEANDL
jgi:hypothetical protein